jgi:hypothetical protein
MNSRSPTFLIPEASPLIPKIFSISTTKMKFKKYFRDQTQGIRGQSVRIGIQPLVSSFEESFMSWWKTS